MRRWIPYPIMAGALVGIWLLAQESVTPGSILLGIVLALTLAWTLTILDVPKTRFRRFKAAVRLALVVLVEIVRSNNAVARIILSNKARTRRSGFVRIPLEMRNPYGLTALACIITATPGTIWVEYESVNNTLLLHVLDLIDEEAWVKIIKERYESRLMEILQ
jgi:multicomponent K+:H+ antiporter subunit E